MATENRKEALKFAKETLKSLNTHKYKKLKDEDEIYTKKRLGYNRALRIWREIVRALKENSDEK